METLFASPTASAAREPGAPADDIPGGVSFINKRAAEDATVESPRAENLPAPQGSRFRRVLQSWPVTAGAVVLIVGSAASVFLLGRGAGSSSTQSVPKAAGEATQPVVPQMSPQVSETLPQPSPTVTPEVMPLTAAPGTYDSFPFTTGPQEVTVSPGAQPPSGAASNVPSVVSESDIGGGRANENDATRNRANSTATREATTAASTSRAPREGEGVDEGSSSGTPPQNSQPRPTGVETRRAASQPQPPSTVNTPPPTPTPAERRKVIQWP